MNITGQRGTEWEVRIRRTLVARSSKLRTGETQYIVDGARAPSRSQKHQLRRRGRIDDAVHRNSLPGPLATLNLGGARARTGDAVGARVAYQDFLNLWKDADPDIPILKQAKAEYAKLQ